MVEELLLGRQFTWSAIWAYDLSASRRVKIISTISSEYSLLELFLKVFDFEGMMDFGEELVRWYWNENRLKVGGGLSKRRCIFTTNTRFVQVKLLLYYYQILC